jgi:serine/threonine protein kinase
MLAEPATYRNALTLGSRLLEYRLDSVLGAGGFGMTYLAWDVNLEKHVAIKEYLPGELAVRALDGSIVPVNTESEYNYKWGLERFVQEARTLAKFKHPNIVRVNRYFEVNGTSYMVMDYEAGESLNQYLKRNPAPTEEWLKQVLMPILDGLQAVHKAGFLHRDIKPSNVFIREDGTPVLLDFGSARLATGGASRSLTAIVSPGYAPLEQYAADGNQGPWSDIYALSGVLYRAVTGENPPDAIKRMRGDSVPTSLAVARARYDQRFLRAIEWGMNIDEGVRPKSVAEWRELFSGREPSTALNSGAVVAADAPTSVPTQRNPSVAPILPASQATGPAASAPKARETASRLITRSRWKWLRRGAFIFAIAIAASVYFKQRALEKSLKQAAMQQHATELAPDLERRMTQRFESADTDRNGALSRAELAQRLPAYANRFAEIDANGDGMVSLIELTAFMQKEGLADELRDIDRKAPEKPVPAASEPKQEPKHEAKPEPPASEPPAGPSPAPPSTAEAVPQVVMQEFAAADRDGNGFLTPDEVRGRFPYIERNFSQVDANGDGRISPLELAQLRKKQLMQKFRP